MFRFKTLLSLAIVFLAIWDNALFAQSTSEQKWDVSNPPGNRKKVSFQTDEGTWMSLDVSPDGKTIIFDLLGDIYQMPSSGGNASLLLGGIAWEVQPRFSPDGKKIVFTSDRGGADNIWTMNADGSQLQQITKEDFRLLNNPVFTPNGEYIIARKHFTSSRSLGAGELWMYHIGGGKQGVQLTKRKNDQQDLNEPSVSPDGIYVYFSEDVYPGGYFQYNKDPNKQIYAIKRLNLESGEFETIAGGNGGACRPQISRDGSTLAFVRRFREQSVLFIQDIESGREQPIFDQLSKDQQEAWAIFGTYPSFAWHPDQQHIIVWAKGKIWKINTKNLKKEIIPFQVAVEQKIADAVHFNNAIPTESFTAKAIRHAVSSPDGSWLVFHAAGKLWKKKLPNGTPSQIMVNDAFAFEPSFSPDGRHLAVVTWNDTATGSIRIFNFPNDSYKTLPLPKGIYRTPRFSKSGNYLTFVREDGNEHQGFTASRNTGIFWIDLKNPQKLNLVSKQGESPQFMQNDERIFYKLDGGDKVYKSIGLYGQNEHTHFSSKYANDIVISPDGNWIAFTELYKPYIAPFVPSVKPIDISQSTQQFPVSQLARDAGYYLHWSGDSKTIHWTLGDEFFSVPISKRFKFVKNAVDSIPPPDSIGLKIGLQLPVSKPNAKYVLINANLITMEADSLLVNSYLVVDQDHIAAIGNMKSYVADPKIREFDLKGAFVSPGIVDVHAHLGTFRLGLSPQKQWSYYANLAYGVTTTHDPSSNSEMVFSQSEMVKHGTMVGPRIFSTGWILYGADGDFKAVINSLEDAKSALRRTKAWGAFSVKSYNQPRREQRQQIIEAARSLEMNVVPEGGSFFNHNMNMILDGHTGIEHNIPVSPLYKDVLTFWGNSNTGYTPTLIVSYGAINGENYWYEKTNVWEKDRLLRFTPQGLIESRSRHREMIPNEEYKTGFMQVANDCNALSKAGVSVNLGAHGQLQGLGAHWELWMLQMGFKNNYQTLKAASLNGAKYLGMDEQIGSIKIGKLADLIVFEKNPLDDIRNTESLKYTIINGFMYNSSDLKLLNGPGPSKPNPFYWEFPGYHDSFPWHEHTGSHCSCRH
jgi:Tol biopolymer transport system component/imidazolonepropionase-like amidohydrolase